MVLSAIGRVPHQRRIGREAKVVRMLVRLLQSKPAAGVLGGHKACSILARARGSAYHRDGKTPSSGRIGFLEHPPVQREIVIALEQAFGVPVAALHTVQIAAIDMDGRGQAAERVRHRVDHVAPQRLGAPIDRGRERDPA